MILKLGPKQTYEYAERNYLYTRKYLYISQCGNNLDSKCLLTYSNVKNVIALAGKHLTRSILRPE